MFTAFVKGEETKAVEWKSLSGDRNNLTMVCSNLKPEVLTSRQAFPVILACEPSWLVPWVLSSSGPGYQSSPSPTGPYYGSATTFPQSPWWAPHAPEPWNPALVAPCYFLIARTYAQNSFLIPALGSSNKQLLVSGRKKKTKEKTWSPPNQIKTVKTGNPYLFAKKHKLFSCLWNHVWFVS